MITNNKFINFAFFQTNFFIFWSEEFHHPNRYIDIKEFLDGTVFTLRFVI